MRDWIALFIQKKGFFILESTNMAIFNKIYSLGQ
jgi:hypothetical protein